MRRFLEAFISVFIVLVVLSTVFEEVASIFLVSYKDVFVFINFIFDFVFTLEFIIRSVFSKREGGFYKYFTTGLGWIDFVSSIPLLLLNSGPTLYSYLTINFETSGLSFISFMSVMKIAKIIRVTRIFRLLRFLKLLKNLNFLDSKIAQRHVNYLVALVISLIILSVIVFNILDLSIVSFTKDNTQKKYDSVLGSALEMSLKTRTDFSYVLKDVLIRDEQVIECSYRNDKILVKDFKIIFSYLQYIEKFDFNNITVYYIDYSLIRSEAIFTLILVVIILVLSFGITFIYSKKFAVEISDPIILVAKGFNEPDFYLRLREDYKYDDELKDLISGYNNIWLNTKVKYSYEIYEGKIKLDTKSIDIEDLIKGV